MGSILLLILTILGIIGLILIYKFLKPYIIKYNTTLLMTGELGAGKTLEAVKKAIVLIRKMRIEHYYIPNAVNRFITRPIKRFKNWCKAKNKKRISQAS